ncbi:hypothetical protein [Actinomadura rubrisoli]|uniref:hypothetical protein n=1 Tax=Actinomadura rubrisoli TaxID=2530368 RepID=UPI001FB5964F|nr:hypothetical protein [Actinomadura rubrisoli]
MRTVRALAMRHRGWDRDNPGGIFRPLPGDRRIMVDLDPITASELIADLTARSTRRT